MDCGSQPVEKRTPCQSIDHGDASSQQAAKLPSYVHNGEQTQQVAAVLGPAGEGRGGEKGQRGDADGIGDLAVKAAVLGFENSNPNTNPNPDPGPDFNPNPDPEPNLDPGEVPLVQRLVELVNGIASASVGSDYRRTVKKECSVLARRAKLLAPLFDELKELHRLPATTETCLRSLEKALMDAAQLIKLCHNGSKIYLVVAREDVENKFLAVTQELEQALDALPYDLLEISDEVREQVELVHAQLKRAKGRVDTHDSEIDEDLAFVLSPDAGGDSCRAALERLAEKLQLKTLFEIKQETRALNQVSVRVGGEGNKEVEQMSFLLRRFKGLVVTELEANMPDDNNISDLNGSKEGNLASPIIPEDFKCPISLELMKEPVIIASGQTYDRSSIQKWLDAGNRTCPKTQQVLPHLILTPNYVLRSLIYQWCEVHGVKLPKKAAGPSKIGPATLPPASLELSPEEQRNIEDLVIKLGSEQPDEQRAAAGELRLLAKKNAENRVYIGKAGAAPLLVSLLAAKDLQTQEHAVTALLNLSIHEGNKGMIVMAGGIDPIVDVLKKGSTEARENAAATLFSLSVVDDNKVSIGASGAIPALVALLREGTLRGKKDAATALFNLSIYQGNKARAVRAGVVPPLLQLLVDPGTEMVDEALAILAILATHPDGKAAIGTTSSIPIFVEMIREGSPRNRENAAAILLALCQNNLTLMHAARQLGAFALLTQLIQTGTSRARRKATVLLELLKQTPGSNEPSS